MIYNLVIAKNTPYSNTKMANLPEQVVKDWDEVFSEERMKKYGAEWVAYCDCTWANEEYSVWAVNTYSDVHARIEHMKEITKAGWFQYADLFTLLGIDTDGTGPQKPNFPNPIYSLWVIRNDPAALANYNRLSKEEEAELWRKHNENEDLTGACMVLRCKSYWANEEYWGFGISAYPSIEALVQNSEGLEKLNWPLYFKSFTLLGIPREG